METKYIINNATGQTISGNITINGDLIITGDTSIRPYKVYTALLSQEGSSAPQAIVLENTIGTLSWDYRDPGYYGLTSQDNLFIDNKTFINNNIVGGNGTEMVFNRIINKDNTGFDVQKGYSFEYIAANNIRLKTYSDAGTLANDIISTTSKICIEIRVYN